ncbi:MAG: OmpH family outer membrane protein [Nitrospirales bacterium]|nr:OmpH family outer membrane protein [Nitrospirales bacterium]
MKKSFTGTFAAVLVSCLISLLPSGPAYGQLKLGVLDILATLNDSSLGRQAKAGLTEQIQSRQAIIDEKEKEIEGLRADMASLPAVSGELRERRVVELGQRIEEYTETVKTLQREIEERQEDLTRKMTVRLKTIVEEIGQVEEYSLILDRDEDFVLYCDKALLLEVR